MVVRHDGVCGVGTSRYLARGVETLKTVVSFFFSCSQQCPPQHGRLTHVVRMRMRDLPPAVNPALSVTTSLSRTRPAARRDGDVTQRMACCGAASASRDDCSQRTGQDVRVIALKSNPHCHLEKPSTGHR